ncbi:MAG: ATP-binding protein [Anaerolineae bacterium]
MTIPTNHDFASEVRADRLSTLWQVTLTISLLLFWLIAMVGSLTRTNVVVGLLATAYWAGGCLLARWMLRRNRYSYGAWSYGLGAVLAAGVILFAGSTLATELTPFVFPVIVFMVGLLLSPRSSLFFAVLSAVIITVAPHMNMTGAPLGYVHVFAITLSFISWLLAGQVTGELYQITQWALSNYQRERKTALDLFDNRQELERTLRRTQALGEQIGEANKQLEAARQAAEEATRYRGQFLANMSHELRTPLNAIIGFSETMLRFPAMYDDVELPAAYQHDLNQIFTSGRYLLNLINDILDMSKVDAGKLELHLQRIELKEIIDGVLSTAAMLIEGKSIRLEKDLPEEIPDVWADEYRLRQVLLNLYSNAVKFTDSGSITVSVCTEVDGVRIGVTDTGSGIDPRFHDVIFEEFKQAETVGRDPRSGAGLGLAISRQLMKLMDGRIWVESEVGKGSTFYVRVPLHRPDSTRPTRLTGQLPIVKSQSEPEFEKVI